MKIFVTGTAGFIGYHLTKKLVAQPGYDIYACDNLSDYYNIQLKQDRLQDLGIKIREEVTEYESSIHARLRFYQLDLQDLQGLRTLFDEHRFDYVIHLAAQPGVRYSLEHPHSYTSTNVVGFLNLLECCRTHTPQHLIYASSSSVYGLREDMPLRESDNTDHPISLYAATKKSNELLAHTYSHLFRMPTTGLRFFTVYGPWGRPDMAPMLFADAILHDRPIQVFNQGEMIRDFTYIDDIVDGIYAALTAIPAPDPDWTVDRGAMTSPTAPYQLFNIGNSHPIQLLDFISELELALGKKAIKNFLPIQPGDVRATFSDTSQLRTKTGYQTSTDLRTGVNKFVDWYLDYHHMTPR